MERKVIIVSSVVGFLGLLSAALGFAAEATRIKGSQVKFPSEDVCIYPRSPALGLGLTAAVSLMVAQITINVATGCMCCCRRGQYQAHSNWRLALICFIVSWFTSVVAFLFLLTGAALNDEHGEDFSYYYCYVVKPGVFAGAAVLSLASVVLGLVYYYIITSAKNNGINNNPSNAGIVMGQPQFPPQNAQQAAAAAAPVLVHEDTYLRRQGA